MERDESSLLPEQQINAATFQQMRAAADRRRCSIFAKVYLELGKEKQYQKQQQQQQQQQLNKKRRKATVTRYDCCDEEDEDGIGLQETATEASGDELQLTAGNSPPHDRDSVIGSHLTPVAEDELMDNDSDFDTDLEDTDVPETPFDLHGTRTYLRSCRKLRLTPISRIVLELKSSVIALKHRGIDDSQMLALAHSLLDNTTVTELYIDDDPLTTKSVGYLCLSLHENLNIHTLSLSNAKLSIESVKLICDVLLHNTVIKRLNLSGNALTDRAADLIGRSIGENHSLIDVNLSHNQFTDGACDSLGNGIVENESILTLDLSWNQIRSHGAQTLCQKLERGCLIRHLNLSMNGLGEIGSKAVGNLLKVNGTIDNLDLTSSRINDRGAIELVNGLIANTSLKDLKISENPMTSVGVYGLLNGLLNGLKKGVSDNSRLTVVDARSVRIQKEVVELYEVLRKLKPDFVLLHGDILSTKSSVIDDKLRH